MTGTRRLAPLIPARRSLLVDTRRTQVLPRCAAALSLRRARSGGDVQLIRRPTRLSDVATVDVWSELRRLRCQFADRLEVLDEAALNSPSWCEGWRVRDVLGHLVHLAEATQRSMVRDVVRGGIRPDGALRDAARRLGDNPVPELAGRLRAAAGGRFHVLGTPAAVALGEVLVHGADALRPLGLELEAPPEDVTPVLDAYWRVGRVAFHAAPQRGRRLVATDVGWTRGKGPEVTGRAIDLLLLIANRHQAAASLGGPGAVTL